MMTSLTIIATVTPLAGFEDAVEKSLIEAVKAVRNETGCLQYDLHVSPRHPVEYFVIERWETIQAQHAHENGLAFEKLSGELAGKASLRIKILSPVL